MALSAQDFPKLHFTVDDGLPSNTVYSIYRDSKGYLWFATDKGVARYNGIRFEKFTTANDLPDNEVFYFKEDYEGRLWMATYNGEPCYYKDGKFHSSRNTASLTHPFNSHLIRFINIEYDSSVSLITANNQVFNFTKSGSYWFPLFKKQTLGGISATVSVNKISPHSYRVLDVNSSYVVDTAVGVPNLFKGKNLYSGRPCNSEWINMPGQSQNYVANGCDIFDGKLNVIRNLPTGFMRSHALHGVYHGGGNWIFSTNYGAVINDSVTILGKEDVTSATQDLVGNFWFSTLNNGVYVLNKSFFSSQLFDKAYNEGIMYARPFEDKGCVFFADDTSNVFVLHDNKVQRIFRYRDHFEAEPVHSYPSVVIDDSFRFYYNSNWKSFVINDLFKSPISISTSLQYLHTGFRLKKSIVGKNGDIYVNVPSRVFRIEAFKDAAHSKVKLTTVTDTAKNERMYAIAQSPDKSVWLSTNVNVYGLTEGRFTTPWSNYRQLVFRNFEVCGKYVVGATPENKLLVCWKVGERIFIDTVADGNCVWDKLYVIDSENVLVSTNDYYRMLSIGPGGGRKKASIRIVDDPFLITRADLISVGNRNVYFFKSGSIVRVDKDLLLSRPVPPKVTFTTIRVNGVANIIGNEIGIPYSNSKNITVNFSALSFSSRNTYYQYSISKGTDNWIDLTEERINILNPAYGRYTVKVRARTLSSDFGEPVVFTLNIFKPFWATWWFITIAVLLTGVIIWFLIRTRVAAVLAMREREHENKVRFMKSEYKALNALMNPHFIFNTLNNVQSLVNKDDKRAANEYLRIFADLVRQNMHNVSNELIPLEKEMKLVNNYLLLEKLRFKENLHYKVNVDINIDLSEIMVPPLLIQPLVENSIKHGIYPLESAEGVVIVDVYEKDDRFHIDIRDNGVGLAANARARHDGHTSFGLENVRQRIEQLSVILDKEITFDIYETLIEGKRWTVAAISMPA